nr:putative integron gene cassette protein [uncultured bacterium]
MRLSSGVRRTSMNAGAGKHKSRGLQAHQRSARYRRRANEAGSLPLASGAHRRLACLRNQVPSASNTEKSRGALVCA